MVLYQHMKNRSRTVLIFAALVIAALFGVSLISAWSAKREAIVQAADKTASLLQLIAANQKQLADQTQDLLKQLAADQDIIALYAPACSARLKALLASQSEYANFGVIAPNGDVICSAAPFTGALNYDNRTFFQKVLITKNFVAGEFQMSQITGEAVVNFGYPLVSADGRVRAVVFAGVDLTWLQRLILENQLPLESAVSVVDKNGTVLTHFPDPDRWTGHTLTDSAIRDAFTQEPSERSGGTVIANGIDGARRVYTFLPVQLNGESEPPFFITIGSPEETITAQVNKTLAERLTFLEFGSIILLGITLFTSRRDSAEQSEWHSS